MSAATGTATGYNANDTVTKDLTTTRGGGMSFGFFKDAGTPLAFAATESEMDADTSWDNINFGAFSGALPESGNQSTKNQDWSTEASPDNSGYEHAGAIYTSTPPVWSHEHNSYFNIPNTPELNPLGAGDMPPPAPHTPPPHNNNVPAAADAGKCEGGLVNSVDAYFKCSEITGGLFIMNSQVTTLSSFANVQKLSGGGTLQIANNTNLADISDLSSLCGAVDSIVISQNPRLTSLTGLNCITHTGQVVVTQNIALEGISGLEGLHEDIAFGLAVTFNPNITSLEGLQGITDIGYDKKSGIGLQVSGNKALTDLDGLASVSEIRGSVLVQGNEALASIVNTAVVKGKDKNGVAVSISHNMNLTECTSGSFDAANSDGSIELIGNTAMSSVACIDNLQALGSDAQGNSLTISDSLNLEEILSPGMLSANGSIIIQNVGAQTVSMPSLVTVGQNSAGKSVVIGQNAKLTTVTTATSIIEGSIHYYNNAHLTASGLEAVTTVGSDSNGISVEMTSNDAMVSVGMGNLTNASGAIVLVKNDALETAFTSLTTVGQASTNGASAYIGYNAMLDNSGLCAVSELAGGISMVANPNMTSTCIPEDATVGATNAGQSCVVTNNAALTDVSCGGGDLAGGITINNNPALEMLTGLNNISSLGADSAGNSLEVAHNAMLRGISGMKACSKFQGALTLQGNPMLATLKGLRHLTTINGANVIGDSILIYGNPKLTDLHGIDGLSGPIPGAISLQQNGLTTLYDSLQNITSVGRNAFGNSIEVLGNERLADLMGFLGITQTPGAITIDNNPHLDNLKGLANVRLITGSNANNASLELRDNGLTSIDGLCALGGALPGSLTVTGNAMLRLSAALQGLDAQCGGNGGTIEAIKDVNIAVVHCVEQDTIDFLKQVCDTNACETKVAALTACTSPSTSKVLVGSGAQKLCGGASGGSWSDWSRAGSSGLYLDVDTSGCNFEITPAYIASVAGDSGHWQLVGVNSIYSATATGFRVYIWHPILRGSYLTYFAKRHKWKVNWAADDSQMSGITKPGNSGWVQYAEDTIYVDVDTTACAYTGQTPALVTSLHGLKDHWRTTGVHAVYNPTLVSFRVYVAKADDAGVSVAFAEANQWAISWIGSQDRVYAGISSANWKMFCASKDMDCGASAQFYAIYNDVDTTPNGFLSTPACVTSISGTSHHLLATGGASIYRASKTGFRVYLDKAPSPLVAKASQWRVNYACYEQPVDCVVSKWGAFDACSQACGGGTRTRTRTRTVAENHSGKCPSLTESVQCNMMSCDKDCQFTGWSQWSTCSRTCGTGVKTATRQIKSMHQASGAACPTDCVNGICRKQTSCVTVSCPVHCTVSDWQLDSAGCSKTCGTGVQKKTRSVVDNRNHGGRHCPALATTEACNTHRCPVDCAMRPFLNWTTCTQSCGTGTQYRTTTMIHKSQFGGKACTENVQNQECNTQACPNDCQVTDWADWGSCSVTCGPNGTQDRTRTVVAQTAPITGTPCPTQLVESRSCSRGPCPVDCDFTAWSAYSVCSKSCGSGSMDRTRSIVTHHAHRGSVCPNLSETKSCNNHRCPVDCEVGNYGSFYACSRDCGGGKKFQYRTVTRYSKYGGKACPSTSIDADCNTDVCPRDCSWAPFPAWTSCSETCGDGTRTRTRTHDVTVIGSGAPCTGNSTETENCNLGMCPVNCQEGAVWTNFSTCSRHCGTGTQTRTRTGDTPAEDVTGTPCQSGTQTQSCNTGACDQDCTTTAWAAWGDCTVACGNGTQTRWRAVSITKQGEDGADCPNLLENQDCNTHGCPVDCEMTDYTWAPCTKDCGTGTTTGTRTVATDAAYGGTACPADRTMTKDCNTFCCAGSFGPAGDCEVCPLNHYRAENSSLGRYYSHCPTCLGGQYTTTNGSTACQNCTTDQYSAPGNTCVACPTNQFQETPGSDHCSDCPSGKWTESTSGGGVVCNSCANGKWTEGRAGRLECVDEPVDCHLSAWSSWGNCTTGDGKGTAGRPCGGSLQHASREMIHGAEHGGAPCQAQSRSRTCAKPEYSHHCPVDCVQSGWIEDTTCSTTCGGGQKTNTRTVTKPASFGGVACLPAFEHVACETQACPVDCQLTGWSTWSTCTQQCNGGTQEKTRGIARQEANGGDACAQYNLDSQRACNTHTCDEHCRVSDWSDWDTCTNNCGGGTQSRTRSITDTQVENGAACPALSESQDCNFHNCPIDCSMGGWTGWSQCSVTCGTSDGTQVNRRAIDQMSAFGGVACSPGTEVRVCSTSVLCPIDCHLATYTSWSDCSTTCGHGHISRTRQIITEAEHGGVPCHSDSALNVASPHGTANSCDTAVNGVCTYYAACNLQSCAANCTVTEWGGWSDCTATCGGGTKTHKRHITDVAVMGGNCEDLTEDRACNVEPCSVDCTTSNWTLWSDSVCSRSCGGGIQTVYRSVTRAAQYAGNACGPLSQDQSCNTHNCPTDCVVGNEHNAWSSCSVTCGNGTKSRTVHVVRQATNGGASCPAIVADSASCNEGPCPVHCNFTEWSAPSDCTEVCGGGTETITRSITQQSSHQGTVCPELSQTSVCNTHNCTVDCEPGAWQPWTHCTASCEGGTKTRSRSTARAASPGGAACILTESEACNAVACPVDCEMSAWVADGDCSVTCGNGTQLHTRSVVTQPVNGRRCPRSRRMVVCEGAQGHCPVDCSVSDFGEWSSCDASCGTGTRVRERNVTVASRHGGTCPINTESVECNTHDCPVDCVGEWEGWLACTATDCNATAPGGVTGIQSNHYRHTTPAAYGGVPCAHAASHTKEQACVPTCNQGCSYGDWEASWSSCSATCGGGHRTKTRQVLAGDNCLETTNTTGCISSPACPIDCVHGPWHVGAGAACSVTCGGGKIEEHRNIGTPAANNGIACGDVNRTVDCNMQKCSSNCDVSAWSEWSGCSATCGVATRTRTRSITTEASVDGTCDDSLTEPMDCTNGACGTDCTYSSWGNFSTCSADCGTGQKERTRTHVSTGLDNTVGCNDLQEYVECNTDNCAVDCVLHNWTAWVSCDQPCGGGLSTRTRGVAVSMAHLGEPCGIQSEQASCNTQPCVVDCIQQASWSDVSTSCPELVNGVDCGDGTRYQTRTIITHAAFGGAACIANRTIQHDCGRCPMNCTVSAWTDYSACTTSCGGGKYTKTRSIVSAAAHNGTVCPSNIQVDDCNTVDCPTDCEQGAWVAGSCSESCGGGIVTSTRPTNVAPSYDGKLCGASTKHEACNTHSCPVDCEYGPWSLPGPCSLSCGGNGTMVRTRLIGHDATHGGAACNATELSTSSVCNLGECPVHCNVTSFSAWSNCTESCGAGTMSRTRSIISAAAHSGTECPALEEKTSCNTHHCPIDCTVGSETGCSVCTRSCGNGTRFKTRNVVTAALYGGAACDWTLMSEACNEHACPVDCMLSPIVARPAMNTTCSVTCGHGTFTSQRSVARAAAFGGKPCDRQVTVTPCHITECPIDCEMTAFSNFSTCSRTCGTGYSEAYRTVVVHPQFNGWQCNHTTSDGDEDPNNVLRKEVACNTDLCPVHCDLTVWTGWSECSQTCGAGNKTRTRTVITSPDHNGTACEALSENKACNHYPCPVHCVVSEFGAWDSCDKTCGSGVQHRTRTITTLPKYQGFACPYLEQGRACNAHHCPVDCQASEWSTFSACSITCIDTMALRLSGETPMDSTWVWSDTDHTWLVHTPSSNSAAIGHNDSGVGEDYRGTTGGSGTYSAAPHTGGYQFRTRSIIHPAIAGGVVCPTLYDTAECEGSGPCAIDCEMSDWTTLSACSKSCGGGTQYKSRVIVVNDQHGSTEQCGSTMESNPCNEADCPIDCELTHWAAWSGCSASCADADDVASRPERTRTRSTVTAAQHGGASCGVLSEKEDCNTQRCPIDCVLANGGAWSEVTYEGGIDQADGTKCGYGTAHSNRTIDIHPEHGGKPCGILERQHGDESGQTNISGLVYYFGPCNRDCEVSTYTSWTVCSGSCIPIKNTDTCEVDNDQVPMQHRTRSVIEAQFQNGAVCPDLYDDRQCNTHACPQDAVVGNWSSWEPIFANKTTADQNLPGGIVDYGVESKDLGNNAICRHRTELRQACNGGIPAPTMKECKAAPCVDHKRFGDWSLCSKKCGTGKKWRHRNHVYCSRQAALKYDVSFLQGVDCNAGDCDNDSDRYISTAHEIPTLPEVDGTTRRLNEHDNGAFRTLDSEEQKAYSSLPASGNCSRSTK